MITTHDPVREALLQALMEEVGVYGLQCATTGELAPRRSLVEAVDRLASSPAVAAEAGKWVMVPREPTEAMWTAGRDPIHYREMGFKVPECMKAPAWRHNPDGTLELDQSKGTTAVHVWRAMIQAAPPAPSGAAQVQEVDKTVPWPAVDAYSGGGSSGGVAAWLKVRLGDGPETTEFIRKDLVQVEERQPLTGWLPIETAPQTGRTLLLGYLNSLGKWRTLRGQWFTDAVIQEEWTHSDVHEAGWFETSVECDDEDSGCWPTDPTHWMPLPAPPGIKSAGTDDGAKSHGSPKA